MPRDPVEGRLLPDRSKCGCRTFARCEHWVPVSERDRLRKAADEAITTLALLRGYVEPGKAWDSEPWSAINACIRILTEAQKSPRASDEGQAS